MLTLPVPNTEELVVSEKLSVYLREKIQQAGGYLSFAEYMNIALYAPGLGYYVAGKSKFGRAGDFITAPEISSAFSHCLAKQIQAILPQLDEPNILEFGAGSGVMAVDILDYLAQHDSLPKCYFILEPSPDLQALQQQRLAKTPYFDRVTWLNCLPSSPLSAVVLANEVLDALPVHRVEYRDGFEEIVVNADLVYETRPISNPNLKGAIEILNIDNFKPGYQTEINLWYEPWLRSLYDFLVQGAILIIDYGYPQAEYYHPDRSAGTLSCYYRHHMHSDALRYPGLQDITAHVNFTALATAADTVGFSVDGYCHQAAFLLSCGIEKMSIESSALARLIFPAAMGEAFKVLALSRNLNLDLQGFNLLDQRGKL